VRSTLKGHRDFIYSLTVVGGVALSGAGDGLMIAHDVSTGKTLWGVGANTAAVRCIVPVLPEMGRQTLVAAGDDGKALIYDM
jgi:F-box/WD-40 domain protein 7